MKCCLILHIVAILMVNKVNQAIMKLLTDSGKIIKLISD